MRFLKFMSLGGMIGAVAGAATLSAAGKTFTGSLIMLAVWLAVFTLNEVFRDA